MMKDEIDDLFRMGGGHGKSYASIHSEGATEEVFDFTWVEMRRRNRSMGRRQWNDDHLELKSIP